MHFRQNIHGHSDNWHFDCLDCGECFSAGNSNADKGMLSFRAMDDNGYELGPYCSECAHAVMKEGLNGGSTRRVVPE